MLIVGLGNPGGEYRDTYHNIGFITVDKLAKRLGLCFKESNFSADVAEGNIRGKKVIIAKPLTFMNLSGESVALLINRFKLSLQEVVIVYDDIDLPVGAVRVRRDGSAGTHNGMRSVVKCAGETPRIRIGTGMPENGMELYAYVLSKISGENKSLLESATEKVAAVLESYVEDGDFDKMMRECNKTV